MYPMDTDPKTGLELMRAMGWTWEEICAAMEQAMKEEEDFKARWAHLAHVQLPPADPVPPEPMGEVQQAWAVAMWDTLRDGAIREEPEALMRMR